MLLKTNTERFTKFVELDTTALQSIVDAANKGIKVESSEFIGLSSKGYAVFETSGTVNTVYVKDTGTEFVFAE